jgi:hypothetical protein
MTGLGFTTQQMERKYTYVKRHGHPFPKKDISSIVSEEYLTSFYAN